MQSITISTLDILAIPYQEQQELSEFIDTVIKGHCKRGAVVRIVESPFNNDIIISSDFFTIGEIKSYMTYRKLPFTIQELSELPPVFKRRKEPAKRRLVTQIKDYFKRLKTHPGIEYGVMLPILGALAGGMNKSAPPLIGMLWGFIVMAVVCWSMILVSNFKSK